MSFRIQGLPAERFQHLFSLSDAALATQRAVRKVADGRAGYPCRVSLTDARPGESVILVNYEHLPGTSPYRATHAIYVRAGEQTYDARDEVPDQLRARLLSVRAFDVRAMLTGCVVVEGRQLEPAIERLFSDRAAQFLHVHYAAAGCYAARVERAA